jgi:hypothetical protein
MVTKVKLEFNSVEVHPQLSHNGHPVDCVLLGASSLIVPGQVLDRYCCRESSSEVLKWLVHTILDEVCQPWPVIDF